MNQNTIVAIYHTHREAEAAIKSLKEDEFDLTKLSIVGKDYHTEEHIIGYYNAGDRMKSWGANGVFWGSIWGVLFGSAIFAIPGIGPLAMAGPIVSWLVGILEGAVVLGAFSVVGAALYSLGIPEDSVLHYETALRAGKFVLITHGSMEETLHARAILSETSPESLHEHANRDR